MAHRFQVTKKYGHERGLSCAFRQWRATHSHCSKLHGYAIAVSITVERNDGGLDDRNWVADYGSAFRPIKQFLEEHFDHTTLIAADDPELAWFKEADDRDLLDLVVMENGVGCERFAEFIAQHAKTMLPKDIKLVSVTVHEHDSNSATWYNEE